MKQIGRRRVEVGPIPSDECNAQTWKVTSAPPSVIPAFNLEAAAEAFLRGPLWIGIKSDPAQSEMLFHLLARVCLSVVGSRVSVSIYGRQRGRPDPDDPQREAFKPEILNGLVVRHVEWNEAENKRRLHSERSVIPQWPAVRIRNAFLASEQSIVARNHLSALDNALTGLGREARRKSCRWEEMGVFRSYDWGNIDILWTPARRHESLEKVVPGWTRALSRLANTAGRAALAEMEIIYRLPPSCFNPLASVP